MAFDANGVPARHVSRLPYRSGAVDVVAVAALDETFVDSMVIRLREVRFGSCMTPITEIGLRPYQQMLGILGMMRRVAVQAANIVARVCRCREVPLLLLFTVATQATSVGVLL